ncbi:hypothetical protein [Rossellomorea marisflavi]|uniref:hypothetical protein n=1 Tax=Rossellomorea marisflavi TaxID=189381 RepID=UPI00190F1C1F|nr:hypothetical protein [Rossellomorea marisflavi]
MNGWMKWLIAGLVLFMLVPNRYRLLNLILGSSFLRKWAVRWMMGIPAIRSKFIQSTFR